MRTLRTPAASTLLAPAALLILAGVAGCGGVAQDAAAPESPAGAYGYPQQAQPQAQYPGSPGGAAPAEPSPAPAAEEEAGDASVAAAPMPMPMAPPPPPAAGGFGGPGRTAAATSTPAPRPSPRPEKKGADGEVRSGGAFQPAPSGIRAGEWDDNANYRDFIGYIGQRKHLGIDEIDISARRFLVVNDSAGKGVPGCLVKVRDEGQRETQLTTTASGRAILFPRAMGLAGGALTATTDCQGQRATARFDTARQDGVVQLKLNAPRAAIPTPVVDVAFVLDTTGSMSEEIREVKETLRRVTDTLAARGIKVRIGMVEYKDKTDSFVTRTYPMTTDVQGFAQRIAGVSASGGGDTPENVNEGLEVALRDLAWSKDSVARLAFVIADAPPHLDYQDAQPYSVSAREAAKRGIQLFTVATSGMDELGQAVFRQLAQLTGGTNMFVLRGGAGPQSTGAGDAASSCGGTHQNFASGNLDQLITRKIAQEMAALQADPLRIAGLDQDERAKPCDKRVLALAE
jgi:Mg-chelatase subunit ChlD